MATEMKWLQNLVHIELEETSLSRVPQILLQKNRELDGCFACFSVYHRFDSVFTEIFPKRWLRG